MARSNDFNGLGLRTLGPESWGRRLARARVDAGLTLRDVEALLRTDMSRATLDRLEKHDTVPPRKLDRARAFQVLILYGWDPTDFELSPDDRPPARDLKALAKLRRAYLSLDMDDAEVTS